jgi:hypothetical protein
MVGYYKIGPSLTLISSIYMIKHLNLARFESHDSTQECGIDTHTFESQKREQILYSPGETERLNGPKSVVGPFDENRCVSKAGG